MFTFLRSVVKAYFTDEGKYINPPAGAKALLAKQFDSNNKDEKSFMPRFYDVVETSNPTTLVEVEVLLKRYARDPEVALLRASPTSNTGGSVRRNAGTFNSRNPSHILQLDIDSVPSKETRLEIQVEEILEILHSLDPVMFPKGLQYVAKASGSSGVKKGIRVHMYLKTDRAINNAQAKYLALLLNKKSKEQYGFDLLDPSFHDAVHLIYCANPVFENPKTDPYFSTGRFVSRTEGNLMTLPEYNPEITASNTIILEKQHYSYIENIEGLPYFPTEDMENRFNRLKEATDAVFMRHSISLYAAAIESGTDIKWLDEQVTPILEAYRDRKRGAKSVSAYIRNAKNAALKIILGRSLRVVDGDIDVSFDPAQPSLLPVDHRRTDSKQRDRYLHINELPPEDTITFMKASLGCGKTTTVQAWLATGKVKGRALFVTNTVSLVSGNAIKLESGMYNNLKDFTKFKNGEIDRMSTTIHSLHRFRDTIQTSGLDFLFIDEADAVMNDLIFSDVVKERELCISTLSSAIQAAKHVILSDGDISPETVEGYTRLCDPVKPVNMYNHQRKMLEGATAHELPDAPSIWTALQGNLDIGEKCLLVSDCSPKQLREHGGFLRKSTGRNIKEVHKGSTGDADIVDILNRGNDALIEQGIDGLLCSPSVTSGVDFSYFDTVFLLTNDASIHTPNLRFQALRRDRTAKSIYYFTSKATEGFETGYATYDDRLGWIHRCRKLFARRRELECKRYQSTFRMLLRDQGCKVVIEGEKWGKMVLTKEERQSNIDDHVHAIMTATPSFQELRYGDAWEDKQNIVLYYEDVSDLSDVKESTILRYLEEDPVKKAKLFHKIVDNFWKPLEACKRHGNWDPLRKAINDNPHIWCQSTGKDARIAGKRLDRHLKAMGLDPKQPGDCDLIVHWYRIFCQSNNLRIPLVFQTEWEKSLTVEMEHPI